MEPRKHAEVIKAWADGEKIEFRWNEYDAWRPTNHPHWEDECHYRVRPEPKPDHIDLQYVSWEPGGLWSTHGLKPNLKLTFDGETGKLKSAEVV